MESLENNGKLNKDDDTNENKKIWEKFEISNRYDNGEEMKRVALEITKFIEDKKVKTIIALERSGRPAGLLVLSVYKKIYPNEKVPDVFFLNPNNLDDLNILERRNSLLYKHLIKDKEEPVMVLDEYCSSGDTIKMMKSFLIDFGINKVYCASLGHGEEDPGKRHKYDFLDIKGGKYYSGWYFNKNSIGVGENGERNDASREDVVQLRKEINELSEEIKEEYLQSKPNEKEGELEKSNKIEKMKEEINSLNQKEKPE